MATAVSQLPPLREKWAKSQDDLDASSRAAALEAVVDLHTFVPEELVAMAERAVELGRDSDYLTFRGEAFEALADVHRLAGRKVEAGNALRSALELFERKGDVVTARRLRQDEA